MNVGVVRDVVAVILQGGRVERKQPYRGDAQVLEIVELLRQPLKISDPVIVAVIEGANVQFLDDRVCVPRRIIF